MKKQEESLSLQRRKDQIRKRNAKILTPGKIRFLKRAKVVK